MATETTTQCKARVQQGTYSYAARNAERQCSNQATRDGLCHVHQPKVTPMDREEFAALKAKLFG